MFLAKPKFVAIAMVLTVLTVALSGCGGGIATALRIAGVSALLPDKWTEKSSTVRLVADILSGNSLREVIAHITHSGDSKVITVIMSRTAEGTYEGTFAAPAPEAQPETYTAVVTATDETGNQATSDPVTVEVPPASDTPVAGQ